MENKSFNNFISHLENYLTEYDTYENLALFLGVSDSTLKSWLLGTRSPKLSSIDIIANRIGCYSSDLINNMPISDVGFHQNCSRDNFVKNINIIFIENQCFSMPQKLNLLNNSVTDYALISYLRKSNYRTPTLSKLDLIANQLNINSFELIKEID